MTYLESRHDRTFLVRAGTAIALLAITAGCGVSVRVLESATGGASGTGGVSHTGGTDTNETGGAATGGTTSECGDTAISSRWEECSAATDEISCQAAGGNWANAWFEYCECPTGQGSCPCTTASECLGVCVGALDADCSGVTQGYCSATNAINGCHCFYWDDSGVPQQVCVN